MKSLYIGLGCALLVNGVLSRFLEPPPTTADPKSLPECTWWHVAGAGDTCDTLSATWGLTGATLTNWNPSLASGCKFVVGNSYCIEKNYGLPDPEPTPSTSSAPPTVTAPANGIVTPSPIQDNMTKNCNKFHLVVKGDGCSAIGSKYGVSFSQLLGWNPSIGSNCETLQLDTRVCVGVIGGTTPPSTT
jgi:hypothetical protein